MANEITITAGLLASKTSAAISSGTLTKQQTMTGAEMVAATQVIATAGTGTLDFGAITGAPGAIMIKNLDTANYVTLGLASEVSSPFAKIRAGALLLMEPGSDTIYAKANTAAVRIQMWAVEV